MLKQPAARKFPTELKQAKYEIEAHARDVGLDFFPVIFEVLDYRTLNEVAAYGGFPQRYPHWSFGMQFEELSKSYAYGLSKIYEMVVNNDPCYAYLLRCNNLVDQKLVMAHVYAHGDFFKHNCYFAPTNRKMVDEMANHAARVQRYVDRYGTEAVESFLDCCLGLENLIDPQRPFMGQARGNGHGRSASGAPEPPAGDPHGGAGPGGDADDEEERRPPRRLPSKGYMDRYINPPDFLQARAERLEAERTEKKRFPEAPEADVLLFLIEHAPLRNWQRDVLSMIREEAYYFLPQAQTKIMNEGWATYWHSRIMTERVLTDGEIIDYADHHAGTLGGSRLRLNPYKLGVELFRDIEERWDTGRFGREYEACDDLAARERWDTQAGLGRQKIFEVRRLYNDLTFIDTFLTEDFCRRHRLFVYAQDARRQAWVVQSREFAAVKEAILAGLTNRGHPLVRVADGNFENRGELLLAHHHEGQDLRWDFARDVLATLHRVWKRPVHVETIKEGKRLRLGFDGRGHQEKPLD
ncbi:MAG: SpoVR family protein [Candidatus Methylomirabilales bacterium]